MGKFDNLNDSQLPDILRRLERLERGTPMNNAAIGRGGIEVYDGGVITITNGGLSVTGTATITGTLQADGTITFTGTFNQSGPTTFTGDTKLNGPTHINGATDIKGTLSVEGASTLKGNLDVTSGGEITAGNTKITANASNGGILFNSGGGIGGVGGSVIMQGSGNAGQTAGASMASTFAGSNSVDVTASSITLNGPVKAPGLTSTSNAANVYFDPATKQLYYKP